MQRPTGVTIIAILGLMLGPLAIAEGLLVFIRRGQVHFLARLVFYEGLVYLIGGVLVVVIGVGLLRLHEWSRIFAIVLNGLHFVIAGIGLFEVFPYIHSMFSAILLQDLLVIVVSVLVVTYLVQPNVRRAFRPRAPAAV